MCVWERKKTQQDPFNNEEEKNCSNRSVLLFYDSKQSIDVWESVMNDFQNNKTWGEKKTKRERKRLFLKHTHTHTTKLELENTKLNRSTSWLVAGFFSKKNRSCRTRKRESATRKKQTPVKNRRIVNSMPNYDRRTSMDDCNRALLSTTMKSKEAYYNAMFVRQLNEIYWTVRMNWITTRENFLWQLQLTNMSIENSALSIEYSWFRW